MHVTLDRNRKLETPTQRRLHVVSQEVTMAKLQWDARQA
eukprot:COSAG06_NODE_36036_length_452_cov_1.600567_1_plen_38_part_10